MKFALALFSAVVAFGQAPLPGPFVGGASSGGGGGGSYTLPAATSSSLGGVKCGTGTICAGDGTITASGGTASVAVRHQYTVSGSYNMVHGLGTLNPLVQCALSAADTGTGFVSAYTVIDSNTVSVPATVTSGILDVTCLFFYGPAAAFQPAASFSISVASPLALFQSNSLGNIPVTLSSVSTSTNTVTPSATTLPSGVSASFSPPTVTVTPGTPATTTMTLTAGNSVATGSSSIVVSGTDGTLAATGNSTLALSGGLSQQWYLNQPSGSFLDSSGNTNNLSVGTLAYTTVNGNSAPSFTTSSSSYAVAANHTNTDFAQQSAFSISFWVKMGAVGGGVQYDILGDIIATSPNSGWYIATLNSYGSPVFFLEFISNFGSGAYLNVVTSTVISAGTLYHVVFTYNNSAGGNTTIANWTAYINGVAQTLTGTGGSGISSGANTQSGLNLTLNNLSGSATTGGSAAFALADLRIFNRAISATEATAIYTQGAQ